jgi:hypothetical protein
VTDNFYFTGNLDLKRCGIWQTAFIALLHGLLFIRKYRYMEHYPTSPELAAAYLAHRSFYLYTMALRIKRLFYRLLHK